MRICADRPSPQEEIKLLVERQKNHASLSVDAIKTDGGTQSRARIDDAVVSEYADALGEGASFPPVVVFYDGSDYWLADGFHRHAAHRQIGLVEIDVDVQQWTRRDAVLYSVGANNSHGLRRTNEDKRRAVLTLLNDSVWSGWSDNEIAVRCGVTREYVNRLRNHTCDQVTSISRTFIHPKTGTVATMQTANIGGRKAENDNEQRPVAENWRNAPTWQESRSAVLPWAETRGFASGAIMMPQADRNQKFRTTTVRKVQARMSGIRQRTISSWPVVFLGTSTLTRHPTKLPRRL